MSLYGFNTPTVQFFAIYASAAPRGFGLRSSWGYDEEKYTKTHLVGLTIGRFNIGLKIATWWCPEDGFVDEPDSKRRPHKWVEWQTGPSNCGGCGCYDRKCCC